MLFSLLSASCRLQTQFLFQVLRHLPSEILTDTNFFPSFFTFSVVTIYSTTGIFSTSFLTFVFLGKGNWVSNRLNSLFNTAHALNNWRSILIQEATLIYLQDGKLCQELSDACVHQDLQYVSLEGSVVSMLGPREDKDEKNSTKSQLCPAYLRDQNVLHTFVSSP